MKGILRTRRRKITAAILALLIAALGAAYFTLMPGSEPTSDAFQWDEITDEELSAELQTMRSGVEDNRDAVNEAIRAVNEVHQVLDGQAEQVAALLQTQQSVSPAVLEVQMNQLAETVQELSLILGQTRRQTQEITELAGAVSTLQRRLQITEAELEASNSHVAALEDEINRTREMAKGNQLLLADPTIFAKPELEIDWENIGTPEALGLCRNSQLWDHQPPSTPGMTFNMDMSRQFATYYRNEMDEGRLTEAQARSLLAQCQAEVGFEIGPNTVPTPTQTPTPTATPTP